MSGCSIVRITSQIDNQEPKEIKIIKRYTNMDELDNEITDEELNQIIKDMDETPDEDMEYLGDEELDDEDAQDMSDEDMMADDETEDEYL